MIGIRLIIDNDTVDHYNQYYFSQHPKAKKRQIEHPYHPSINVWSIKPRIQMNSLKQSWKNFIIWFIAESGYSNTNLTNVDIFYDIYHPTNRRTDPDNYTPKFIHDGFVESGLLLDDDRGHIKSLTIRCHVDKENPRTEINIIEKVNQMTSEQIRNFIGMRNCELSADEILQLIDVNENPQLDHIKYDNGTWEMWDTNGEYFKFKKEIGDN